MSGETFKRGGRYSIIPAKALYSGKLTHTDILVLGAIGHHTDQDGWCFFNQRSLADAVKIARETVVRSVKRLTTAGFLEHRDINAGKSGKRMKSIHVYRVLMDAKSAPSQEVLEAAFEVEEDEKRPESRCDPEITSVMCAQDHNGCDATITTVVTPGSQLNDPLRMTPLEQQQKGQSPPAPADASASKRGKGRKGATAAMDFGKDADAAAAEKKRELAAIDDLDRSDFDAYQKAAAELDLNVPAALSPKRRQSIQDIRRIYGADAWAKAVANLRGSNFCTGRKAGGFRITFDMFVKEDWFLKVLEGNFMDRDTVVPLVKPADVARDAWLARMKVWKRKCTEKPGENVWPQLWGPAPGQPGCSVPADILAQHGIVNAA